MSIVPTYPGVYIQEVPSGSRTITGVSTSICAFVGRTARGPLEPTTVFNWTEFTRTFGGLWQSSTVSYAVQQFFVNGGGQAIILRTVDAMGASSTTDPSTIAIPEESTLTFVSTTPGAAANGIAVIISNPNAAAGTFRIRIVAADGTTTLLANTTVSTDPTQATFVGTLIDPTTTGVDVVLPVPTTVPPAGTLTLAEGADAAGTDPAVAASAGVLVTGPTLLTVTAANPGAWGDALEVSVNYQTRDTTRTDLFNLIVREFIPGSSPREYVRTETFLNVSALSTDPRSATSVLAERSELVDIEIATDGTRPPEGTWDLEDGSDGAAVADNDIVAALDGLDHVDLYNLLCIPPLEFDVDIGSTSQTAAVTKARAHRALFLADAPDSWTSRATAVTGMAAPLIAPNESTAMFFPRILLPDPLQENRLREFAPCGAVAGVIARTDGQRGVWKAPAGLDAGVLGVRGLAAALNDDDHGQLNPLGLNVIRSFPVVGTVVWGSRTLRGADILASEWKYVPVRRMALHIEESLYRGTQWAVFEPNDEPLWAQLRLAVGSFMHQLFRRGAFQGSSPREAYFVKCDSETTTQADIDLGIVNVLVGFAPLKPAEFVIIRLQQIAGETAA